MEDEILKEMSNNLGEGSIGKLLFKLSLPAVISQLVNMLYNMVDRMYIGHIPEEGLKALTGLGLCFPIIMLVSAFSSLFGMGGAPKAAIEMGKGDNEKAEKILGNAVFALLFTSVVLTTLLLIFGRDLLFLFGASSETITYAWSYLKIYLCGTIFVQVALGLNMFITTQGFAKYSMITVVIGAILNIILDPIFIFVLNMGVKGAALATIISQAVSSIWVIKFLCSQKSKLKIRRKNLKISLEIIIPIIALGLSPFVMQSTESLLNICFNASLQRYGGDVAVGAMTILGSVMQLCSMPIQGFAQGAQPIISFNYGAGKMERVKKTIFLLVCTCVSFTVVMCLVAEIFPEVFISIFNSDPELMETAVWAMRIYIGGLWIFGAQCACQQSFIALGEAKISLFLACLRKIVLLIPLIYILPNFFTNKVAGVFFAEPVTDILASIITSTIFVIKIKSILNNTEREVL